MNEQLEETIDELTEKISLNELKKARESLTLKYKGLNAKNKKDFFQNSEAERLSYLLTRMPATYGVVGQVIEKVLEILDKTNPDFSIETLIDLGSGPGTAFFAALERFKLKKALLIEQDKELIALGKTLAKGLEHGCEIEWQQADISSLNSTEKGDLLIISYALNELSKEAQLKIVKQSFEMSNKILILIEPGTKIGFENIREARAQLIGMGAHLVAPCTHEKQCPMKAGDWCHFSKRIERSSKHRNLKEGLLGYEDEKYSYVVVSKEQVRLEGGRILRHPKKMNGHMTFEICSNSGELLNETISKKAGESYKAARKLNWGYLLFA